MAAKRKTKASAGKRAPSHNGNGSSIAATHWSDRPRLSSRPAWQGNLKLSLVSCPVALFNATSRSNDISFHLINPETNNRIRMIPTDPDTGPIERSELVKGYELEKNRYVIMTNDELNSVRLETTKTIEIDRFVDAGEIDRLYWNDPYYLTPNGKEGIDAFVVIRDALEKTGRIALGRVVMHTRERLVALEPRDKGIVLYTLRVYDEVISPAVAFENIPEKKTDHRMIEIAEKIIEQQEGDFEPEGFKDRYEIALRDLIKRKERGEKPVEVEPREESNVIDLMEALKRSLKNKAGGKAEAPARARSGNGKPARKRA